MEGREEKMEAHDNKHNGMLDVQKRVFIWMYYYYVCCTCGHSSLGEKFKKTHRRCEAIRCRKHSNSTSK